MHRVSKMIRCVMLGIAIASCRLCLADSSEPAQPNYSHLWNLTLTHSFCAGMSWRNCRILFVINPLIPSLSDILPGLPSVPNASISFNSVSWTISRTLFLKDNAILFRTVVSRVAIRSESIWMYSDRIWIVKLLLKRWKTPIIVSVNYTIRQPKSNSSAIFFLSCLF